GAAADIALLVGELGLVDQPKRATGPLDGGHRLALRGPPSAVEAAGRVALEVERDELVARLLESLDHGFAPSEERLHLLQLDLDASDIPVVADPDLGEAERLHRRLRALDQAQRLDGDRSAVRDPRAKAGEGWLVPVGQAQRARRQADLGLAEPGLEQREAHTVLDS